jgi:hypothetical protein
LFARIPPAFLPREKNGNTDERCRARQAGSGAGGEEVFMMTTPLVRGRCRIVELLAITQNAQRDDSFFDIIPAVSAQLALEEAAIRALCAYTSIDCYEHVMAHARARLSMFRLATARRDSTAFRQAISDLAEIFDERPYALLHALAANLTEEEEAAVVEEMKAIECALDSPAGARREPTSSVQRCEPAPRAERGAA